jgi:hypothetical protein
MEEQEPLVGGIKSGEICGRWGDKAEREEPCDHAIDGVLMRGRMEKKLADIGLGGESAMRRVGGCTETIEQSGLRLEGKTHRL